MSTYRLSALVLIVGLGLAVVIAIAYALSGRDHQLELARAEAALAQEAVARAQGQVVAVSTELAEARDALAAMVTRHGAELEALKRSGVRARPALAGTLTTDLFEVPCPPAEQPAGGTVASAPGPVVSRGDVEASSGSPAAPVLRFRPIVRLLGWTTDAGVLGVTGEVEIVDAGGASLGVNPFLAEASSLVADREALRSLFPAPAERFSFGLGGGVIGGRLAIGGLGVSPAWRPRLGRWRPVVRGWGVAGVSGSGEVVGFVGALLGR